jgi:ABC-type Na+ efflux pump permease subunit
MRFDKAMLIFRKDWIEVRRNWEVMGPIVILPLILAVGVPAMFILIPGAIGSGNVSGLGALLANLPDSIRAEVRGMTPTQSIFYLMLVYVFSPFFLMIPTMASSVISSDSFAGEKERRTIEGLLATPLTDGELLMGKILVSFVPSMLITTISWVAYTTVVDLGALSLFGRPILPTLNWFLLILGLAPTFSSATIGLTVMISARVKGFREAQQLDALLVIPLVGLIIGQVTGVLMLTPSIIIVIILILVILDYLIFQLALRVFAREKILQNLQ